MSDVTTIHRLRVLSTDDPLFQKVARMVRPPQYAADKTYFEAAYASFDIAQGTEVDLSFYYEPASDSWGTIMRKANHCVQRIANKEIPHPLHLESISWSAQAEERILSARHT